MKKIEGCRHCNQCSKRCPYGLDTPALSVTVCLMNGITYSLLALPVIMGATRAWQRLRA